MDTKLRTLGRQRLIQVMETAVHDCKLTVLQLDCSNQPLSGCRI